MVEFDERNFGKYHSKFQKLIEKMKFNTELSASKILKFRSNVENKNLIFIKFFSETPRGLTFFEGPGSDLMTTNCSPKLRNLQVLVDSVLF